MRREIDYLLLEIDLRRILLKNRQDAYNCKGPEILDPARSTRVG